MTLSKKVRLQCNHGQAFHLFPVRRIQNLTLINLNRPSPAMNSSPTSLPVPSHPHPSPCGWGQFKNASNLLLPMLLLIGSFHLSSCGKNWGVVGSRFERGDKVDLRAMPTAGFKWIERGTTRNTFMASGDGTSSSILAKSEVVASNGERFTVKTNESTEESLRGAVYTRQEADAAKTRLKIVTYDRCGKVLEQEGISRDDWTTEPFPDRPIKLGESFTVRTRGNGLSAGESATVTYTLQEVTTLGNRRMARLSAEMEGSMRGSGTEWRDLETGLIVKSTSEATMTNFQGLTISMRSNFWVEDENGRRWID
jgi:hypothetical protein